MSNKKIHTSWNKGLKGAQVPWNKGKICPQISAFLTGKKRTQESKLKQSLSKKGKPSGRKGMKLPKEWVENMRKSHVGKMTGKSHPNWKGGATSIQESLRTSKKYAAWRKEVFERDGYKCTECGSDKSGNLNADHYPIAFAVILDTIRSEYGLEAVLDVAMKYPKLWDINNGRTLCVECHKKTETYGFKKGYVPWNKSAALSMKV